MDITPINHIYNMGFRLIGHTLYEGFRYTYRILHTVFIIYNEFFEKMG